MDRACSHGTDRSVVQVSFENIVFSYGQRPVLRGVSLSVESGKLVAIMGGSGSGKTTLLRLLSGQIRADTGCLVIDGRDMTCASRSEWSDLRRDMGCLFQFGALFTDLSVYENVAFPLWEHGGLKESLVDIIVRMKLSVVGLHGCADLMPSELSGGMARRVALARALVLDPKLVLYDEPFTGLDPLSLSSVAQLVKYLHRVFGTTALLVSHDIDVSLEVADYVYLLRHGVIAAEGDACQIRAHPDPWVQSFLQGKPDSLVDVPVAFSKGYAQELGIYREGVHR